MKTTVSLREGSEATDKAISYYHTDHLGSSSVITDENGNKVSSYEYQPYGKTAKLEGSDVTNYKFTGKELDSTGLYYYSARYYDPEIGRFTQADTIVQSPYDPQTLNRYTYCRNNPIKYIDPTGHFWAQLITTIIVIAIGWGLDQTGHAEVNVSGGTSIPFGGGPGGSGGGTNQPSTSSSSGYYPSANSSYGGSTSTNNYSQYSTTVDFLLTSIAHEIEERSFDSLDIKQSRLIKDKTVQGALRRAHEKSGINSGDSYHNY